MESIWNLPKVDMIRFSEIEEKRSVLLITSAPAWDAVKGYLHIPVLAKVDVTHATISHWDAIISSLKSPDTEVVYAVGGGLAADAGKYIAARTNRPLVCLPTALSVDAFITAASGVRSNGCVKYVETKSPEMLILDLETIAAAPAAVRSAGITDVLSIATGSWDWQYADAKGMNPKGMELIPWVYENAHSILEGALDCAEAAGAGDREGLKTLFDCLAMEVQLCNQVRHARPEEGSEHYFAYAVENHMGHGLPHGDLVGPGILIAAQLQKQDTTRLERALQACHIPLENIPLDITEKTLKELPEYVFKHQLAYGIAHEISGILK